MRRLSTIPGSSSTTRIRHLTGVGLGVGDLKSLGSTQASALKYGAPSNFQRSGSFVACRTTRVLKSTHSGVPLLSIGTGSTFGQAVPLIAPTSNFENHTQRMKNADDQRRR